MGLNDSRGGPARTFLRVCAPAFLLLCAIPLRSQGPEGSLQGVVTDIAGAALPGVEVTITQSETGLIRSGLANARGECHFGGLPRGIYTMTVRLEGYRGTEIHGIELAVGGRHEERVALSRSSAEPGADPATAFMETIPSAPGLPVGTIASSVSVVVEENRILQLPLASRNIYSLFLLQPGVTSQGGIVRRGLSFSVHGQRVSGSNYRLDGVDNNNIVLTGPATPTTAEAIQEFRMVNSSFSAEDGRATGFVAQVATRSGSNQLHGGLFEYFSHDKLNANTFQNNSTGTEESSLRRNQYGLSIGGPISRNQTFFFGALELSKFHYGVNRHLFVPTASYIQGLPQNSLARQLLTETPPVSATPTFDPNVGEVTLQIPSRIDTTFATARFDHNFKNGSDRLGLRFTGGFTEEERGEEFLGYPDLYPTDDYRAQNLQVGWNRSSRGALVNDLRAGWSRERIWYRRPRDFVPFLQGGPGYLPSNLRQAAQRENNNVFQFSDTVSWRRGRSALTMGFEYRRNLSSGITLGIQTEALGGEARLPDGFYSFPYSPDGPDGPGFDPYGNDLSLGFYIAVDRFSSGQLRRPDLYRKYYSNEYALFVQDDIKLNSRLSLNVGLRYEYFGIPHSSDRTKDVNFYFGPGSTIAEQIAGGTLRSTDQNSDDLKGRLYRRDFLNLAPSIGIAWDPFGRSRTVVRAGYAVALDRIFDTLRDLRTNTNLTVCNAPPCEGFQPFPFVIPVEAALPLLEQDLSKYPPASAVQLDENLRTPYAQNWYFGVQHSITPNTTLEVGHAGSVGRKLISRDEINRKYPNWPNPNYGQITYLSNAGNSNYLSLETGLQRRFSRGLQFQVSYTYGHAIDNQSDSFEGVRTSAGDFSLATFTREFDARVDRGNANFDQRHNLILNAIWQIPRPRTGPAWSRRLLDGWTASVIGAYRSGFPLTAIDTILPSSTSGLLNNRLDLVSASPSSSRPPVPGGVRWLNPEDYRAVTDRVGNLGRGALKGPGFWNYDFAILKNFGLSERVRIQFRAEFYNLFNHANLAPPVTQYLRQGFDFQTNQPQFFPNPEFGVARFGMDRSFSRFGDLPLESPSRRIQLALRFEF